MTYSYGLGISGQAGKPTREVLVVIYGLVSLAGRIQTVNATGHAAYSVAPFPVESFLCKHVITREYSFSWA